MASSPTCEESPVLHVVVVGFHHKKGCQVEYSYPPLIAGHALDSHDTPDEWRHLPSLALPDGAHNYVKDTIFFHLPSRDQPQKTVYGVSCYRQMDAKDLKNKTADVTRSTVQKSVCVLSKLPLYGLIQAKLELITHAYFDERDFSKVELLEQTYTHLNSTLTEGLLDGSRVYLGLSPRDLVCLFKHKVVLLFKLLLLERRVLFSGAPVQRLCSILLSVVSLFPGMLEFGLEESASYSLQKQLSPTLKLANFGIDMDDYLEISYKDLPNHKHSKVKREQNSSEQTIRATSGRSEEGNKGDKSADTLCDSHVDKSAESSNDPLGVLPLLSSSNLNEHYKDSEKGQLKGSCTSNSEQVHVSNQKKDDETDAEENCHVTAERQKVSSSSLSENGERLEIIEYGAIPDPLANTDNITKVQAVQSISRCQSDALFSDDSPEHTPERELPIEALSPLNVRTGEKNVTSLEDHGNLGDDGAGIKDIDSPESISQIDKEDGFSWEEDRLLLEIDQELQQGDDDAFTGHVNDINTVSETSKESNGGDSSEMHPAPAPEQQQQQQQPRVQTIHRTDSALDDTDMLTETSDEDTSFRIVSKVDCQDSSVSSSSQIAAVHSPSKKRPESAQSSPRRSAHAIRDKLNHAFRRGSKDKQAQVNDNNKRSEVEDCRTNLHQDEYGFPLAIFTKGCLCHPYLCLQYYDLLQDVNVKSFVIGATNVLFKQKRHLTDIVIDVNDGKIDISDVELRKQLQMTTADLRFADVLVKAVTEEENTFLEGTEWEGGDQWLRAQFKGYLLGLLAASSLNDEQLLEDFGVVYVNTWRMTHNYRVWHSAPRPGMDQAQPGHPCQGNLSVNDIRVRFTSAMQSSERGRKINSAMAQTGKYVAQTGRAVGGALNQAKSTFSSWISNWRS